MINKYTKCIWKKKKENRKKKSTKNYYFNKLAIFLKLNIIKDIHKSINLRSLLCDL